MEAVLLTSPIPQHCSAHCASGRGGCAGNDSVFGEVSFGIFLAVLTILILVLTEIIPKTF